jgi:enoyl-CoA hydratase/carnithine racemase
MKPTIPFRASAPFTETWLHFDVTLDIRVLTITLNRPHKLNAITFEAYADLRDLFRELPQRDICDAVILTGAGKGFCSGGDVNEIIGELLEMDPRELLEFTRMTGAVVQNMRECPIPIIAAVNGTAAGAGAVLAMASDFRIVTPDTKFRFLFTSVGLSGGDMGTAYLLPRLVGLGRATEILMFGDPVTGEQAALIGLANRCVEPDELIATAATLARRLAGGPTFAYQATKMLLTREADMSLHGALEMEAMTQAHLMQTNDHAEFHRAFNAGETPNWSGR